MSARNSRRFSLLEPIIAASVCLILVSNIIAQKFFTITLLGLPVTTDVGTLLLFPFTYIFSDVLTEVYAYGASRRVVWYSFAANIFAALLFTGAVALPHSPDFTNQDAFAAVLGQVPGLVVASLAGAWFGSFTNDSVLAGMKLWMVKWDPQHRWLPLHTIGSTVVGEFVDTALFVGVAVAFGVFPADQLVGLVISQWAIKTLVEVVFTPLTVLVIRAIKRYERVDMVGTETWNPFAFRRDGGENRFSN
ncbi:queuosine precursor transporter [Sorangium sp. So ce388]|uniref:queuosine precursor transporter n=1 Tax=Sorangium sp. So ce388 TaxID=3133309 RepID=UPI003F5B5CA0